MDAQRDLSELIRRAARDNKVACKTLFELAERTGTPIKEIGRLCDEMDIRISNCQLGCF